MNQVDQLLQALAQRQQMYDQSYGNVLDTQKRSMDANSQRYHRGLFGMGEAIYDAIRRPKADREYNDSLVEAMKSARGVDDITAQLQAMQEAAKQAEIESLYMQHGMGGPEAALRARGADVPAPPKDARTVAQKNAEAMGLKPGTPEFNAYMREATARKGVTVNTGDKGPQFGKVDPGYVMKQDENGGWYQETIPGSEAHRERIERENKLNAKDSSKAASDLSLLEEVDYARGLLSGNTAGLPGAVSRVVPGSGAVDFEAAIKPILAGLSFDSLQTMRDNSPTGGALGAISERELDLLQSTVAGYDPNMSEQAKARFLDKIERHYRNWYKAAVDGVDPYGEQIQPAGSRSAYEEWKAANGRS